MRHRWLYLHGFMSSARSAKASELKRWQEATLPQVCLDIPELSLAPSATTALIESKVASAIAEDRPFTGLIGSSLGGFYARYLAARYRLPAVLINPALRPDLLLADFLGVQINPYTSERHVFTTSDLTALAALIIDTDPLPMRLLLLTQLGDETLDAAQAIQLLHRSPAWIMPGGNHRFEKFETTFPAIRAFLAGSAC